MPVKVSEIVHDRLGWCPGSHTVHMQPRAGTGHVPQSPLVSGSRNSGSPGAGSRDTRYEHTQRGDLMLVIIGGAVLVLLMSLFFFGNELIVLLVLCILVFVLVLMSDLTVSVREDRLRIRFGPVSLIRTEWPLTEIVSATVVTNPWYYGYGIRWTPHGALYNVSGRNAVEILLVSGKKVRIGTDEPEALAGAIKRAIR